MLDIRNCEIDGFGEWYIGKKAINVKGNHKFMLVFTFLSSETNEKVSVVGYSLGMYGDSILQRNLLSW